MSKTKKKRRAKKRPAPRKKKRQRRRPSFTTKGIPWPEEKPKRLIVVLR
jgi:hypothetical protein